MPDPRTTRRSYVEPHEIATGEHIEDYRVTLVLVLDGNKGRREYTTNLPDACAFDNAYDHASSAFESPEDSDGCWYEYPKGHER
jgi:hypothetical protein